jgi:hypothetical protein
VAILEKGLKAVIRTTGIAKKMKERIIFKYKAYSHFDNKKRSTNWINYIKNPKKIKGHGFYPFIHFVLKQVKYDNTAEKEKSKERDINYSSHIDRYIYEYYNDLLNEKYNEYAIENRINRCVVAYRNNLNHNNITIAKEVFNFLKKGNEYFILIADFSKYFDNINHKYLKSKLCEVLRCDILPDDWYKVFRSVTKYSYIDLNEIIEFKGMNKKDVRKLDRLTNTLELHKLKKYLKTNKNDFGIPQGSSISSTLANVNLIDYDKLINDFVTSKNGIYRRYCDDSIIIIPVIYKNEFLLKYDNLNNSTPGIFVNDEKMQKFILKNKIIYDENQKKAKIKYLGFEFNGETCKIRERTITGFFLKAYRSIKFVNYISKKYNRNAYRKIFFSSFTHLGKKKTKRNRGNFLTYVDRCAKIMDEKEIKKQTSCHWARFSRRLKKINPK